jgi:ubiquinone/menaquinone biosynthesis C-methylase UbiE
MGRHAAADEDSLRFWDKIARNYARRPVADEAAYQTKLAMTREYLRPDMDLLEIGCGTGSTAILHAPFVRSIRAVDISPAMLEIARSKADSAGISNIAFEQASFERLEVRDASCDMVLALSLLHLLEDWRGAIARARRWLKPGGLLVSSTSCMADMMPTMKYVLPLLRLAGMAPRLTFFTLAELKQAHRDSGFTIIEEFTPGPRKATFLIARAARAD